MFTLLQYPIERDRDLSRKRIHFSRELPLKKAQERTRRRLYVASSGATNLRRTVRAHQSSWSEHDE
jgi:hypothetical protein